MAELKLPRLLAAAKEFNIGQDTLVEFLESKGFNKDELKPTAKLSEEQYYALQREFQSDKLAKDKADKIEIPKSAGAQQAEKKRKETEAVVVEEVQEPAVVEAPPVNIPEVKEEIPEEPAAVIEELPVIVPREETIPEVVEKIEEKIVEESKELPAEPQSDSSDNKTLKIEAPEIEGPKILNKIDLSAIDSSTRPKKTVKPKKAEVPAPVVKAEKKEKQPEIPVKPKEEKKIVITVKEEKTPEVVEAPVIENIRAAKLEGPKILGKIELPIDSDTRPKTSKDSGRKRKRIPIENKRNIPGSGDNRNSDSSHGRPFSRDNNGFQQGGRSGGAGQRPQHGGDNRHHGGRPQPARGGNRFAAEGQSEIDQKRIQDKIRETQAKLAGGSSGSKSSKIKANRRREKRQEMAEAMEALEKQDSKLQVTEFITVSELANLMDVSFADVISKCMGLGIMVSINQRLDAEVIELVAEEFGFEVEFIGLDDAEDDDAEDIIDNEEDLKPRHPIVTIMGHVDHGKTSLLDYIRRTKVASGEAGGITQHIGAYVVNVGEGKKITFLDTPGHEAFTAMRARGAKVTDIAVIVVAADDAVMPQTKEAISHAQAAGVPMIFAINKIDKDGANPQKIYEQLSQMNILVEEWGGKFQSQEISAKQGLNVDALLEKILLEAEVLELKANPDREAVGSVVEASLDKGRGYVATILVQNGTLHQGDLVVAGQYFGRMKAMFNELNQRINEAGPSIPVQVLGLNGAPQAGEKIRVYADESEAKEIANKRAQILREQGLRTRKHITLDEIGRRLALGNFKQLNIIIKGDVDGSVEALSDSLQKLSTEEIVVSVVHKAVGQISESDVLLATASDAIILGFNVRASSQAARLADTEGVEIKSYSIIYNAIEEVKSAMEGMLEPKVQEKEVATVEIREVYKFDKATVAGCYVLEGKVKREHKIRLFRDGILIYPRTEGAYAEFGSLKRFKDDVKEVAQGYECGLTLKNFTDIQVGDNIVAYEQEEIKRTL
ncbi:translation initiation factor IF-2 [Arachidicoccus ginsenosidimutans]|uniref:translation initiation factor IF-2 n=1 Tax=Arachidicoccus sp. BS20 TaxID=1850526 RepID=UPI0007F05E6E|nr:translation initiation factor IF-2 [Arachidicoccus sp. BS20]ANI89504.1 translation initiation factor IF-2 [Arachidicoccus sp. BS20]